MEQDCLKHILDRDKETINLRWNRFKDKWKQLNQLESVETKLYNDIKEIKAWKDQQ